MSRVFWTLERVTGKWSGVDVASILRIVVESGHGKFTVGCARFGHFVKALATHRLASIGSEIQKHNSNHYLNLEYTKSAVITDTRMAISNKKATRSGSAVLIIFSGCWLTQLVIWGYFALDRSFDNFRLGSFIEDRFVWDPSFASSAWYRSLQIVCLEKDRSVRDFFLLIYRLETSLAAFRSGTSV